MKYWTLSALLFVLVSAQASAAREPQAFTAYTKGVELLEKKRYADAVERFQRAISQRPGYVAAYIDCARAYVLWGKRSEGLAKLEQALRFAKKNDEKERISRERSQLAEIFYTNATFQHYQNGLNFMRLERVGAAVSAFEKALSLEPDNVAILSAYAQAIQQEEGWGAAVKALELAHRLNPERRETRVLLADAVLSTQPERSLQLIRPVLREAPAEESGWILQLKALTSVKKEKEGLDALREQADRNPRWTEAHYWLGKHYALRPEDGWLARKHLLIFLKRDEAQELPKTMRDEAEALLARVNKSLAI